MGANPVLRKYENLSAASISRGDKTT